MPTLDESRRRTEAQFWAEFHVAQPGIMGALLDAVSTGLRRLPSTRLEVVPRMADFARWGVAVERALRWPKGSFLGAYERNLDLANEQAIEASSVALAILSFVSTQPEARWRGTCSELLGELRSHAEGARGDREFPRTPQQLGRLLRRAGVNLRRAGFEVEFWREGRLSRRMISITRRS